MKPSFTALLLLVAVVSQVSFAQEAGRLPPRYASLSATPTNSDKVLLSEVDNSIKDIESNLKEYFVAFDSRHDSNRKRVGLPLTSFADGMFSVALDISGRSLMAQWKIAQSSAYGNKISYHAYLGESGMVNFAVSTHF
ncbi:MAG: hypothetical protein WCH35_02890 [Comamonadaceae bacterium]